MRVVLVLALVAAMAAADPSPKECTICQDVVNTVIKVSNSSGSLARILTALQHDCDKAFQPNTTDDKLCRELSAGVVALLPEFTKQIESVAWDADAVCAALGKCLVPCCQHPTLPEQVHLGPAADPASMTVMWTTLDATAASTVQYGLAATGTLDRTAAGSNATVTHFGWRGQLHRATMTGLAPNTTYAYRVGDASGGFSATFTFKTLPDSVGDEAPLRLAVVADMGYGPASDATVAALTALAAAGAIDAVVHDGDIGYADGDMQHWDDFLRKIEPVAARVPYLVSPGNHELLFNFSDYKHRFFMPGGDGWQQNMFYSLDVGTALRLVAIDTEGEDDLAAMSRTQVEWLQQTLLQPPQQTRWTLVFGHRPLWVTNHGGNDVPKGNAVLQRLVEDILNDAHVDLVVQGHVHDYERTYPMRKGQATSTNYSNPAAPVYVTSGGAGNREGNDNPPGDQPWVPHPYPGTGVLSFGVLSVTPAALEWVQYASESGAVLDTFTITKA